MEGQVVADCRPVVRSNNRELRFAGASRALRIRPVADRVLLRRLRSALASTKSLWTPATDERDTQTCAVVAVGPNAAQAPHAIRSGDTVAVPSKVGGGLVLRINGEDHLIVRARDILAVLQNG